MTRKITMAVARRIAGAPQPLRLGNLDSKRDWGFAGDYVRAMWKMLQVDDPADYVIATGETHSVRDFVTKAYEAGGIQLEWEGVGAKERGISVTDGDVVVEVADEFFRPAEVDVLIGDASRAQRDLGFAPSVSFDELVGMMVRRDIERIAG